MKKFLHSLSVRQMVLGISGFLSLMVCLLLLGMAQLMIGQQVSQQMAERWGENGEMAQISCFFSQNANVSLDTLEAFRHSIDGGLQEASVVQDSPNASARLWADAYSAGGRITVVSDRGNLTANALGVGGDFFLFHPLQLLDGAYFSESDLNSDYCILDEVGAWQLFGSNNIAGMIVSIGGRPHVVAGVVHREEGRLQEAAGLDSSIVYVSYDTLQKYDTNNGINHYEVVMPNPVKKFAYNYVSDHIGVSEADRVVVENTTRYDLAERFKLIMSFGVRSMSGKAIIYPYWENIARGYEDIVGVLTLWAMVFLVYPTVLVLIAIVLWWKHKTWTARSVYMALTDKAQRQMDKARARRKRRKKYKDRFDDEEEFQ